MAQLLTRMPILIFFELVIHLQLVLCDVGRAAPGVFAYRLGTIPLVASRVLLLRIHCVLVQGTSHSPILLWEPSEGSANRYQPESPEVYILSFDGSCGHMRTDIRSVLINVCGTDIQVCFK